MLLPDASAVREHAADLLAFIAVVSAFGAMIWIVLRLGRIDRALKQSSQLSGSIVDLHNALNALPAAELKDLLAELKQSSAIVHRQLVDLQRYAADERAIAVGNDYPLDSAPFDKWDQMRTAWTEVRDRLEQIIGNIQDGRLRRKYEGIGRYSYSDVNNALRNDGFINQGVSEAVGEMNDTFLSSRRRSRPVTGDELQRFKKLKEEFDLEIRRCPVRM